MSRKRHQVGKGVAPEIVEAGFNPQGDFSENNCANWPEPSAFVQWKGTDLCMDFHCGCGAFCHFDGYFAYTVKCPHCGQVWQMPSTIYPRKAPADIDPYDIEHAKPLEPDEEYTDADGNAVPLTQ